MAAWLAVGRDDAVVSHQSALELFELSDIIPDSIHITLPRRRRGYRSPSGVTIHTIKTPLLHGEKAHREGILVTSPARSIADAAEIGVEPDQIITATSDALKRGLTTRSEIETYARVRGGRIKKLLLRGIEAEKQP